MAGSWKKCFWGPGKSWKREWEPWTKLVSMMLPHGVCDAGRCSHYTKRSRCILVWNTSTLSTISAQSVKTASLRSSWNKSLEVICACTSTQMNMANGLVCLSHLSWTSETRVRTDPGKSWNFIVQNSSLGKGIGPGKPWKFLEHSGILKQCFWMYFNSLSIRHKQYFSIQCHLLGQTSGIAFPLLCFNADTLITDCTFWPRATNVLNRTFSGKSWKKAVECLYEPWETQGHNVFDAVYKSVMSVLCFRYSRVATLAAD